jgi:hypothetical protein
MYRLYKFRGGYTKHNSQFIDDFINGVEKEGIDIIQIPNNHLTFMVVDNVIVWYGNIDILGRSYISNCFIIGFI